MTSQVIPRRRGSVPPLAPDDVEWRKQIDLTEQAINDLLQLKRQTMATSLNKEQVLWVRYNERLKTMKRKLDAIAL